MPLIRPRSLDAHTMRMLRLGFAVWSIAWFVLAGVTAYELYVLRDIGDTLAKTGVAVTTVGQALGALGHLPFVGAQVASVAQQAQSAGQSAVASGKATQGSATTLAVLIGLAIALIPSLPVLALYLPLHIAWNRERGAIARALRERADDPLLDEYLARRAVGNLPYATLVSVSEHPWRDLVAGRFRALADAELERLDLLPRSRWKAVP